MNHDQLLSSHVLHDLPLANRVVMAPLTRARSGANRVPNDTMVDYYRQRAGAGLIISEATTVSKQGNGWLESPGIYTDEMVAGWKKVTEAVHKEGGRMFLQLWHCGRAAHSSFNEGKQIVAPSPIPIDGDGVHTANGKQPHETPRALETEEIPGILEDYCAAAENAWEAGFDGVEIHSANGYLLDTFLQSKTNHRDDAYGGTKEKRFQLLREIVNNVTEIIPASRVGVRFSPNGNLNDMGSEDFREQFLYAAGELETYNIGYLHIMDGLGFGFHELGEPMALKEFREVFSGPLMGNCGYDLESASQAVSEGAADMIAFGRPFISNPDLVERFRNGWPLAPEADVSDWYSPTGAEGYTDFPKYQR